MPAPTPPSNPVRVTERLWDAEVRLADAGDPRDPKETAYLFSNGRRFVRPDPPYEPPAE